MLRPSNISRICSGTAKGFLLGLGLLTFASRFNIISMTAHVKYKIVVIIHFSVCSVKCSLQSTYSRFLTPPPQPPNFAALGERLIRLMGWIGSLKASLKWSTLRKLNKHKPKSNDTKHVFNPERGTLFSEPPQHTSCPWKVPDSDTGITVRTGFLYHLIDKQAWWEIPEKKKLFKTCLPNRSYGINGRKKKRNSEAVLKAVKGNI